MAAQRPPAPSPSRESDHDWGRAAGLRPPLTPSAVLVTWLVTAAVLAAVVIAVIGGPGPLDDPDPGQQRAGFLFDPAEAPVVGDVRLPGGPLGRRPVFVLFDRRGYDADRVEPVLREVPEEFAFFLVVPRAPADVMLDERVRVVADPGNRLAAAFGLNQPVAGGFPIGYVLVDERRRVRYATLDPAYSEHAFEVQIVTDPLT